MAIFALDESKPYLMIGGQPIQWHTGSTALWCLSSSLTRINPHGVMFKPSDWRLRPGLESLPGWTASACAPSAYGLCESNDSIVFPSAQTPLVGQSLDRICTSANTNRGVVNTSRYDPSACDILDSGRDFVWANGLLYVNPGTALPTWAYWTVCALVVFLVRCLSKYILASLRDRKSKTPDYPSPAVCMLACAACTGLVTMQGDSAFVTREDVIFYWFTVFYIVAYGCLFAGTRLLSRVQHSARKDPPFYNLLAGVMQLVACRLYCGAETPYNPPLLFIVATRVVIKSRRGNDFIRALTLLLDSLFLGLGCGLGFSPQQKYLVAHFTAAAAAADVLV